MKTIGIFPASGKLGGSTAQQLLRLVPYDHVVLVCRHPDQVPAEYVQGGVQVRQAAYESSPAELEAAFAGIDVLFLISYPSHVHEYRTRVQLPAIDAAYRAGVSHLLYSSLAFAGPADSCQSCAVVMQAHLDTEGHLRDLVSTAASSSSLSPRPGFRFTTIREGLYAESLGIYTAFFNPATSGPSADRMIRIPHDGSGPGIAWVKIDDLGEATARLIAAAAIDSEGEGGEGGRGQVQVPPQLAAAARYLAGATNGTILLSGPRAWTLDESVTAAYCRAAADLGASSRGGSRGLRPVQIQQVTVDEYASQPAVQAAFGGQAVGEEMARTWATAWDAIRRGETSVVTTALAEILGREPQPVFADEKAAGMI